MAEEGGRRGWRRLVQVTLVRALVLALALIVWWPGQAEAAGGVSLVTAFPGVVIGPGQSITFPLRVLNSGTSPQTVDLKLNEAPEGWQGRFQANGRVVTQVLAPPGGEETLDFQVTVPADAKEGLYHFSILGQSGAAGSNLRLSVLVQAGGTGSDQLVTQYPALEGPADAAFQFRVDLSNNGSQERSYSLAAQAPPGWEVTFSPAYEDKQIASLSVKPGESQGLDVNVKPAQGATAGDYNLKVAAVSAAGTATADLKVTISGSYKLELNTPSGRLNAEATAGRETPVNLQVKNSGSTDLRNVTLSSYEPEGWAVTFEPEVIDVLPAGETRQVVAHIKAADKAIAGDYVVTLMAATRETSAQADIRTTVRTSTLWGLVGLALVVLVVLGVWWVFRRYGRR